MFNLLTYLNKPIYLIRLNNYLLTLATRVNILFAINWMTYISLNNIFKLKKVGFNCHVSSYDWCLKRHVLNGQ